MFREVKAARSGELLERVFASVGPRAAMRARMLLEDMPHGASAIARAIKKYPKLERYALPKVICDGYSRRLLSNVVAHHLGGEPCEYVATDTLLALTLGFPRTFPFFKAEFFFLSGLPWQSDAAVEPSLPAPEHYNLFGEPFPHVCFRAHYTPSGYRAFVHAAVALGNAATFGAVLPPLPTVAAECLASFGKPRTHLMLQRTAQEEAELSETTAHLRALHEAWRDRSRREMGTLALPHALPTESSGTQFSPMTLPHKAALVDVFKPRGYRYSSTDSGSGVFVLYKLTANGNRIEVSCDVGSKWRHYSGGMTVAGLRGRCYAPLPAHPKQPYESYDVGSGAIWRQLVENVAVLVDHLEQVFVPEVDATLGRTPAWYEW